MKRILRHITTAVTLAVLLATTIPAHAQHYNWPAERLVRRQIINEAILRHAASPRGARRDTGLRLKHHHSGISFIEGVLARGDRRLADVIEAAWRAGARFDGWDEVFDLERWSAALDAHGVDVAAYLGTRPRQGGRSRRRRRFG